MKYKDYIAEINSPISYSFDMTQSGDVYSYRIYTEEDQDYMLTLTKKADACVAELGIVQDSKVKPIVGDFYDNDLLINTLIEIFTKFHLEGVEVDFIVYKFNAISDKAYILLMISIFNNDLKNYYTLNADLNDLSNINSIDRVIIQTTNGKGQYVDDSKLKRLKSL